MSKQTTKDGFHSIENLPLKDQQMFNSFGRGQTVPVPHQAIHHAFEAITDKHKSIIAVRHHDGTTITYGELERRANILANDLCTRYRLRKGDRVVLVYSRCIEMVVFILAVLKAGGQYIPLDGGTVPIKGLGHTIVDSETSLVLCLPGFRKKVEQSMPKAAKERVEIVTLDSKSDLWHESNDTRLNVDVGSEDGAYIIYTSGTTGKSKGVDVRHGGVTNALLTEPANLGITVGTNVAQQLNVAFDMGAEEILSTIMNGGTLHIRGSGDKLWADCLRNVDTVISTPSCLLKHMRWPQDFPNIRTVVVGGEPCPKSLAETWAASAKFMNICGPTEITILNTCHVHKPGEKLTIGKPISNVNIYILDDEENPIKIGEPGTMWTGGYGVSRGYINLPDLTSSRYKVDKFTKDGRMMFNTGDLGRWLPNGSLETLGRKDDQVKISGFRVELDGIAKSIEQYPTVMKACVLKIGDGLCAFYSAPKEINQKLLQTSVARQQPFYAVPANWRFLPTIELTANGKVDKGLLRRLAATPNESETLTTIFTQIPTQSSRFSAEAVDAEQGRKMGVTNREAESDNNSDRSFKEKKAQYALPPKKSIHGWRWFRHTALSAYRKLFSIVFLSNLISFIIMFWRSQYHEFSLPLPDLVTAVAANLLAAVLFRQDHVVNLIFWLATRLPTSTPLAIRRHFARIYHNGGIHSGCAVSASIWWLIFAIESTRYHFRDANAGQSRYYNVDTATIVLTYLILSLLILILIMAYPSIRMKMHDQFEWTHRFAGWLTLAFVWAHIVVATHSISHGKTGKALARTPGLYLVALTTLSIASSWARFRRVKVIAEPLSRHAVRLHFDFFTPRISSAAGVRISDRPLVEWHAFAAMFEPGVKGFSIVVSRAGDWTGHIIDNPPTSIWTRGTPASGVLAIAPLFKKMVLVATGSGIGPCMPNIMENRHPIHVVWSTKNPLKIYGQKMLDVIHKCDPDAVIWNTDTQGRPDLATLAYQAYKESGAECICVISNSSTTKKLVYRLESRGIPAFGPIWDS